MNLFVIKRIVASLFIAILMLAFMSFYFAFDKYKTDKIQLTNTHFNKQSVIVHSISEKLLYFDDLFVKTSIHLNRLFQSEPPSDLEGFGEIFEFVWGQTTEPNVNLSGIKKPNLLHIYFNSIQDYIHDLVEVADAQNAFLIKQSNKFDFEYIRHSKGMTPKGIFDWLIKHDSKTDNFVGVSVNVNVNNSNGELQNYVIYPLYNQNSEKYFLVAELKNNFLSLPDYISSQWIIWKPQNGDVIATNIPLEENDDRHVKLQAKKSLPYPYTSLITKNIKTSIKLHSTTVEELSDSHSLVVLKYSLWQDRFRLVLIDNAEGIKKAAFTQAKSLGLTLFIASTVIALLFTTVIVWLLGIPVSILIRNIEGLHFRRGNSNYKAAKGWEVWFSLLNQTYKQNNELLKTLTNKGHDLDAKVFARTQYLIEQTNFKDKNLALNRAMMNTIPDMLFYKNLDKQYLGCNSAFETFIGISEQNIVHKSSHDLFEPSRAIWIEDFEQEVIANKKPLVKKRWSRNSAGDAVLIRWLYSPIINNQNIVLGILGLGSDITAQHNNVNELQKAVIAAEKANVVKGEFIANISHEVRTPMNSIIGMLELLDDVNTDPSQKSFIGIAEHSAKNLLSVINNILDFSKGNANKLNAELSVFNINDVLDNAFANSLPKAMKKKLLLDIDLPLNCPQFFISDEVKLTQIFTNLIGNAVKFTHQGSVTVSAELLDNVEFNKQRIKFEVIDTGIGIKESDRQSVFEAFSQADSSVTREYGGTGLGLTIAYQLVRLLGGEITLESEPGLGTRFILTFEFGHVEEQPNLQQPEYKWVYYEPEPEIELLLKRKLSSIGAESKSVNMQSQVKIDNVKQIVLLCRLELIEQIPQSIVEKIQSGNIRLQPITFTLQPNSSLSDLPHLPLLTAPVNAKAMLFNLYQQHIVYPNSSRINDSKLLGKHILIVEDNEMNQKVIELVLESEGATYTTRYNGQEALNELEKQPFDLIITDIQMPIMDGLSLTSRIRLMDEFIDLPIIAMSAHSSKFDIEKSLQAGINEHLTKPIDKPKLIDTILALTQSELNLLSKRLQHQIDVQFLYNQVNQSIDTVLIILNKFYISYYTRLSEVLDDFESVDVQPRLELLHSFKGAVGNIGAKHIYQLTKELEMQLKADSVLNHSVNLWQQSVKQLFSNLVVVLKLAK